MIDCPFDDCLTFDGDTLADHLRDRHLEGTGPPDELSADSIRAALSNLDLMCAIDLEILQLPRAREVLEHALLTARPEAELDVAVITPSLVAELEAAMPMLEATG